MAHAEQCYNMMFMEVDFGGREAPVRYWTVRTHPVRRNGEPPHLRY